MRCDEKNANHFKVVAKMKSILIGGTPWRVEVTQLANGDWLAVVPTLGENIFRAFADSRDKALTILGEIAPLAYEWMLKNGEKIPVPTWEDLTQEFEPEPEPEQHGLRGILSPVSHASTRIQSTPGANTNIKCRTPKRVLHNVPTNVFSTAY